MLIAMAFDRNNDDVVESQGVFGRTFVSVNTGLGSSDDNCTGTTPHRLVTGRNAPTNINATLNLRKFWGGRAGDVFNGDIHDPGNRVFRNTASGLASVVQGRSMELR